jgi:hypothetical protein
MSSEFSVSLDGEEKRVFPGMKVRHLLSEEEAAMVLRGELAVVDTAGRERGLDGALSRGLNLFRRKPEAG